MRHCLTRLKNEIEQKTDYRFEVKTVFKQNVLKLLNITIPIEIYVEFNRSERLFNPYVSIVYVDMLKDSIIRNNHFWDIEKTIMFINNYLLKFKYSYPKINTTIQYKQLSIL